MKKFALILSLLSIAINQTIAQQVEQNISISNGPLPTAKENTNYEAKVEVQAANPVEFSLLNGPDGLQLSKEGIITWQPNFEQAGRHSVAIGATDGKSETNVTLTINVNNTNRTPKITSQAITQANEGQAYSYTINAEDPDEQALTYKLSSATEIEGLNLAGDTLQWVPSYTQAGSYPLEIEVSDGELTNKQSFTITVANNNRAPNFDAFAPEALQLSENNPWQQALSAQDADNEVLVFSLLDAPEGLKLNNNILSWTPNFEQAGEHSVTIQIDDGTDKVTATLSLSVNNTNRAPVFTGDIPTQAKENNTLSFKLSASDADQQALSYSLESAPSGMNIDGSIVSWAPSFEQAGEHIMIFGVSDGETRVTQTKTIMVENTNRAPTFTTARANVQETQTYIYKINATDPDGDIVALSVVEKPDFISFDNNQLTWETDYESAGEYEIALLASDGDLAKEQRFTLVVDNLNRLPKFTSTAGNTAYETLSYDTALSASDADGEALTFSLQTAPKGMVIVDNKTINWTPKYSQQGTHPVTVAVTDGIDTVTQSFSVSVDNANRAPVINNISDQSIQVKQKLSLQLTVNDPDGDKLSFKLPYSPKGMSISRKGLIKFKPSAKQIGEHIVVIEVSDGDLKSRKRFNINVTPTIK